MSNGPQPRDAYWLPIKGVEEDKERLCIVVRVEVDYVEIVYGQGTPDLRMKNVEVLLRSSEAKRLQVTKDTFFRESNVHMVHHDKFKSKRRCGQCSLTKHVELTELVEEANRNGRIENLAVVPMTSSLPQTTASAVPSPID